MKTMETNEIKRPNAALINREWFEAARGVLSTADLGLVMINAACYVFGEPECAGMNQIQRAVFAMIRPALESDLEKYMERCRRNAANAKSRSERVGASGSEWERVGANTTPTPTPTPTSTTTLSREQDQEINPEIERWIIFGYFWSTGSKAIKDELNAFWSYYESLGWKNNKGAAIVSKLAAAKMWRRQFETGTPPNGADAWFSVLKGYSVTDYNAWLCFGGAEKEPEGAVVRLRCKAEFWSSMDKALPGIGRALQRAWKVPAVRFETIG